jgi:hypothetical protein
MRDRTRHKDGTGYESRWYDILFAWGASRSASYSMWRSVAFLTPPACSVVLVTLVLQHQGMVQCIGCAAVRRGVCDKAPMQCIQSARLHICGISHERP